MTLILGALSGNNVVVASDGAEFGTLQVGLTPASALVKDRQKLYPLHGRSVVFAIHGTNRIMSLGNGFESLKLISEIIADNALHLHSIPKVEDIAYQLLSLLSQEISHTFSLFSKENLDYSPVAITIYGFSENALWPECYEVWWPRLDAEDSSRVIQLTQNQGEVRVFHSGSGGTYTQTISEMSDGRYHADRLIGIDIVGLQSYVRGLYRAAEEIQPPDQLKFTGTYQELSITKDGWDWTTPLAISVSIT